MNWPLKIITSPYTRWRNALLRRPNKQLSRHTVLLLHDVIPFAWPLFIELTCVVLMSMASTILVSQLGKSETAAVGISDSITYIIISLLTAIALGGTVIVAQSLGRKNKEKGEIAALQAMNLNLYCGLIFLVGIYIGGQPLLEAIAFGAERNVKDIAEGYLHMIAYGYPAMGIALAGSGILRATGNTRLPMYINVGMNIFNICLSYPLIYGIPHLFTGFGVLGAGIGVTITRWIGALIIMFYLTSYTKISVPIKNYLRHFKVDTLRDILSIGIPASVESLMFNIGKLITQMMVAGMGTVSMAANVITFSLALLVNLPGNALSEAATIMVGQRLGEGRPRMATQQLHLIFWLANILLCLLGLLSVPFARTLAECYSNDHDVIELTIKLICLNALFMPAWTSSFVLPSGFKGAKDAQYTMWTAIISMWGFRIFVGYFLGMIMGWGVIGVWCGMFTDWIFRAICYYRRLLNGRWLKRFIKQQKQYDAQQQTEQASK